MIKRTLANPPVLYDLDNPDLEFETQPTDIQVLNMESRVDDYITFSVGLVGSSEEDLSIYANFFFSTSSISVSDEWEAYLSNTETEDQRNTLYSHCLESAECRAILA